MTYSVRLSAVSQTITPPNEPIGDCPVCGQPYYDYTEKSTCMGVTPPVGDDDCCSRTGSNYYITEYYIHSRPSDESPQ